VVTIVTGMLPAQHRRMTEIRIRLTPTTSARLELVALEPGGPFRLTVEHPARRLVEYFTISSEALGRWAEIEAVLSGMPIDGGDASSIGLMPAA
jgi:hypothetical protein